MEKRSRQWRIREIQKRLEERELNERYSTDWSPSFHDQVKVMEDKMPEREANKDIAKHW